MRLALLLLVVAYQDAMPQDTVTLSITTGESVYRVGESVNVSLSIANDSTDPVTLRFSSGQRFDVLIVSEDRDTVFRWSADKGFIQMMGEEQIGPGEDLEFLETIDRALPAGRYTVVGLLTSSSHPLEARTSFAIQ